MQVATLLEYLMANLSKCVTNTFFQATIPGANCKDPIIFPPERPNCEAKQEFSPEEQKTLTCDLPVERRI